MRIELYLLGVLVAIFNICAQICAHNSAIDKNLIRIKENQFLRINILSQILAPFSGYATTSFTTMAYFLSNIRKRLIGQMFIHEVLTSLISLILAMLISFIFLESLKKESVSNLLFFDGVFIGREGLHGINLYTIIITIVIFSIFGIILRSSRNRVKKIKIIDYLILKIKISPLNKDLDYRFNLKFFTFALIFGLMVWFTESYFIILFVEEPNLRDYIYILGAISLSYFVGTVSLVPSGFITREATILLLLGHYFKDLNQFLLTVGLLRFFKMLGSISVGIIPVFVSMINKFRKE
jgi:hypothetical protein